MIRRTTKIALEVLGALLAGIALLVGFLAWRLIYEGPIHMAFLAPYVERSIAETNRDFPVPVPGKFVKGGNFDVQVRGMDEGQLVGMTRTGVQLISSEHSFAINLLASMMILWLMSVLVVIIAIFCSTFLSWPIAIVLTLLGHQDHVPSAWNSLLARAVRGAAAEVSRRLGYRPR